MKTEDLIAALGRGEAAPAPAAPRLRWALVLVLGALIAVAALAATFGVRGDIGVNLPVVLAKAGFSAVFGLIGVAAVMRLLRPGASVKGRLAAGAAAFASALVVGVLALIGEAPDQRFYALTHGAFPMCLVLIPLFGAPTAALLAWLARSYAPTRLTVTGAAIGGAAGGVGAVVYAMYCPIDGIVFVSVWYSLAIAISAALGAIVISRFLRW